MADSKKRCLYEILNLPQDCSPEEICSSYRRLARRLPRTPTRLRGPLRPQGAPILRLPPLPDPLLEPYLIETLLPSPPIEILISRVNQYDAARLDVEMPGMLKERLVKVFSLMKPGFYSNTSQSCCSRCRLLMRTMYLERESEEDGGFKKIGEIGSGIEKEKSVKKWLNLDEGSEEISKKRRKKKSKDADKLGEKPKESIREKKRTEKERKVMFGHMHAESQRLLRELASFADLILFLHLIVRWMRLLRRVLIQSDSERFKRA